MFKKIFKKTIAILFLGVFLYSGFLFTSSSFTKNLSNIDYPVMTDSLKLQIPFGF